MWQLLLHRVREFSTVVQDMEQSSHSSQLASSLLQRLSDTTAVRYITSLSFFLDAFEELGFQLSTHVVPPQHQVLDALLTVGIGNDQEVSPEQKGLSDISNVLKALRWGAKLLHLPLGDLYGGLFPGFAASPTRAQGGDALTP